MELPQVSPIGLLERPAATGPPRRYPRGLRLLAAMVLAGFLFVTVVSTVVSLGRYCLTSHAGNPPAR